MVSKHFKAHELVPLQIFNLLNESLCMALIDDKLIKSIDAIKERFPDGSMSINNYMWNGDRGWSGIRTKGSPWYSATSQHTLGKAIDAVFSKYDVEEVRQYILDNPDEFPYIKGIELDVSWLHIDVRDSAAIVKFNKVS